MKTTLTLEDVERLEKLNAQWENGGFLERQNLTDKLFSLLPLILPVIREYVKGNPEGLPLPQGASPPVHSDVPPAGRFTHETVKSPGWYWFKSDFPGKGFSDRFVHLEEDSLEDGNKWLMGRNCQGLYFGPIDLDNLTGSIPSPSDASLPSPLSGGVEQVKDSQEGSVCEVGPLGEVDGDVIRFQDGDDLLTFVKWANGFLTVQARDAVVLRLENVRSLIAHLSAWVETGSFRLVPRGGAADHL